MPTLRFRGPRALWCVPHLRADPYSYPCVTPSAARGVISAIYWKPEFEWEVREIRVLAPIVYDTCKVKSVRTAVDGDHTLQVVTSLVDVDYAVRYRLVENPHRRRDPHLAEFIRRARAGQHFTQPYLGRREYPAEWELVEDFGTLPPPIPVTLDLGPMLLDLFPIDLRRDRFEAVFWPAKMNRGVVYVPEAPWRDRRDRTFRARDAAHRPARAA